MTGAVDTRRDGRDGGGDSLPWTASRSTSRCAPIVRSTTRRSPRSARPCGHDDEDLCIWRDEDVPALLRVAVDCVAADLEAALALGHALAAETRALGDGLAVEEVVAMTDEESLVVAVRRTTPVDGRVPRSSWSRLAQSRPRP